MLKIKQIKPLFTKLITTAERYDNDASVRGVVFKTKGSLKEYQKVIAIGSSVRDIEVGDIVMINPTRYIKKKFNDNSLREDFVENPTISVDIPVVEINDIPHFLIDTADVDYVIKEYEETKDVPKIIKPKTPSIKL